MNQTGSRSQKSERRGFHFRLFIELSVHTASKAVENDLINTGKKASFSPLVYFKDDSALIEQVFTLL